MRFNTLKKAVLWGALALFVGQVSPLAAQPLGQPRVLDGNCTGGSWLGEGPAGTDFRNDKPRFFCDAAVVAAFDPARRHVMVQFMGSQRNHGQIIGFAGVLESDGIIMNVSRVYLEPNRPISVSDGVCRFFRQRETITSIVCGTRIETGLRSIVPVMVFRSAR